MFSDQIIDVQIRICYWEGNIKVLIKTFLKNMETFCGVKYYVLKTSYPPRTNQSEKHAVSFI